MLHTLILRRDRKLPNTDSADKQAVQTVVCSLENSNCYSSRDTDNFIHDLSRNRLVLCSSFQPEGKKVSLLINYFAPRWTLNRSKKLCWELVFDWMIGSTTNSRFRYLSSTLRSRSQLTCRINYLLRPTILSFYFFEYVVLKKSALLNLKWAPFYSILP